MILQYHRCEDFVKIDRQNAGISELCDDETVKKFYNGDKLKNLASGSYTVIFQTGKDEFTNPDDDPFIKMYRGFEIYSLPFQEGEDCCNVFCVSV